VVVDADSVTVACADGRIKITRVQADGPKVGAGEWAAAAKIEKGARFS
jgi:methionyl-tRNA formyltransferase